MTEEETRDFLLNTKLFARLGTIDDKTDPNVHSVWYYFDNERIYFQTAKNSKYSFLLKSNSANKI